MNNYLHGKTIGFIGRFQPLHNGHQHILQALLDDGDHVRIGIGSPYQSNPENPFSARCRENMLHRTLPQSNYSVVRIRDFSYIDEYSDGERWREEVQARLGPVDILISGNEWVQNLLEDEYHVMSPSEIIGEERHKGISATQIRKRLRNNEAVNHLIPRTVDEILKTSFSVEARPMCRCSYSACKGTPFKAGNTSTAS